MNFDSEKARRSLEKKESDSKAALEQLRLAVLARAQEVLSTEFGSSEVEVYLVGSVTQPGAFRKDSDIDVVLKGFDGDRFGVWTRLESAMSREVTIMRCEESASADWFEAHGLRVI